jgi:HlyD family secretion protein
MTARGAGPRWKRGGWIVAGLAVVALVVWALRPEPVEVEVAAAEIGPLQVTVEDDGEVRVRDRYSVTAPVAGRVERLLLRAGDTVEAATVVARLDPAPLDVRARAQAEGQLEAVRDAQRAANALVMQARAALEQARRDRDRLTNLAREGVATREAVEKGDLGVQLAESTLEAAQFRAQAAAHDVEVARAALLAAEANGPGGPPPVVVRSPVAGRVLNVPDLSARVVAPGQLLLEIGDMSHLEITVDLLSTDAVKVRPGQALWIDQWGGDRSLAGRVRMVEPGAFTKVSALGIEEQRVNVVGDLLEPAEPLGDRYRVQVRIVLWEAPEVLKVPWSALFREQERWHLYVVEQGYARKREVKTGHQSATEVEILEGLQAGERVVRHPTDRIVDGVRVVTRSS